MLRKEDTESAINQGMSPHSSTLQELLDQDIWSDFVGARTLQSLREELDTQNGEALSLVIQQLGLAAWLQKRGDLSERSYQALSEELLRGFERHQDTPKQG